MAPDGIHSRGLNFKVSSHDRDCYNNNNNNNNNNYKSCIMLKMSRRIVYIIFGKMPQAFSEFIPLIIIIICYHHQMIINLHRT